MNRGGSSDRSFGLVMAAVFLIVAFRPLVAGRPGAPALWAFGVALLFAGLAVVRPRILRPLNHLWAEFGRVLSRVTNPVATGLLFYIGVVPIGLAFRIMGKDPLKLRRDPAAASYWIPRQPPGPSPESMKNQF